MKQDNPVAIARRRQWYAEYRRKRRAAGLDSMGNGHRKAKAASKITTAWVMDASGNLSRELRG